MRLRSAVEKVLPLIEGEKRLSKSARGSVFHGVYANTTGIKDVRQGKRPWILPAMYGMDEVISTEDDGTLRISRTKRNGSDRVTKFKVPKDYTYIGHARIVILGIDDDRYLRAGVGGCAEHDMKDSAALARASRVERVAAKFKLSAAALTAAAVSVALAIERPHIDVDKVNFLANAPASTDLTNGIHSQPLPSKNLSSN